VHSLLLEELTDVSACLGCVYHKESQAFGHADLDCCGIFGIDRLDELTELTKVSLLALFELVKDTHELRVLGPHILLVLDLLQLELFLEEQLLERLHLSYSICIARLGLRVPLLEVSQLSLLC